MILTITQNNGGSLCKFFLGDMDLSSMFLRKMDFSIFKLLIFLMLGQSQIYWNPVSMYNNIQLTWKLLSKTDQQWKIASLSYGNPATSQ